MWRFIKAAALSGLFLLACSCRTPFDPGGEQPIGGREVSIHYLKTLYTGVPQRITGDLTIRGRVVSSDAQGNFRYSLIVEDETGGIELKVGLNPYYERFAIGQQVMVRCAGLVLGAYGRTIQLGGESSDPRYETGFIDRERIGEYILTYGLPVREITPSALTAGDISVRYVNCAVRFDGMQFIGEDLGLFWGDPLKSGYTERRLQFLASPADTLLVRTSPYAGFAAEKIPAGSGSVEGVLTRFAGTYSLVVNEAPVLTGIRRTVP